MTMTKKKKDPREELEEMELEMAKKALKLSKRRPAYYIT